MITTREVNVDLAKEKLKLRRVTTKNVDPSVRVEPPKAKIKPRGISTTTQADVADMAEKKRRDDIAVEKKLMMKDKKKIMLVDDETRTRAESEPTDVEIKKKPWKEMTDAEKKVEMKRRAVKAKATRARKKKEKEKEK